MNVVLFGSAFNPPHWGHEVLIRQALEQIPGIDEVWLLPSYTHSFGKVMASPKQRLHLCQLLAKHLHDQRIRVCPLEIDFQTSGETWDVYQLLLREAEYLAKTMHLSLSQPSEISYHFLMGTDQLPRFHQWDQYLELMQVFQFWIYPRPGYPADKIYPQMKLLDSPEQVITNLSSTLIRRRMDQGLSIDHLVPKIVGQYLSTHQIF